MAYTYLISSSDFAGIRDISSNVNTTTRLNPYIREAQEFDIKPILGDEMYYDLMYNSSEDNYQDLLNGKSYTYNNKTYQFVGLKSIIVYYAYARFIQSDEIRSTPTGFVGKTTEYSEPISQSKINAVVNQNRSAALAYIDDMICYLNRNKDDYSEWCTSTNKGAKKKVTLSTITKN